MIYIHLLSSVAKDFFRDIQYYFIDSFQTKVKGLVPLWEVNSNTIIEYKGKKYLFKMFHGFKGYCLDCNSEVTYIDCNEKVKEIKKLSKLD
jgi:hypothetical protein